MFLQPVACFYGACGELAAELWGRVMCGYRLSLYTRLIVLFIFSLQSFPLWRKDAEGCHLLPVGFDKWMQWVLFGS